MPAHHVLLVEDSSFMSKVVSDTLMDNHGMLVTTAGSVDEAQSLIAEKDVDCVLVKQSLPDGTGMDLASAIGADMPVILFTADDLEPLAAEAIDAGVSEFVHKDDHLTSDMNMVANRIDLVIEAVGKG